MPLIELKNYKPVCDKCGEVGSTWQNIPEQDQIRAVPPGWSIGAISGFEGDARSVLMCGSCWRSYLQTPADDRPDFFDSDPISELPENDSRA